MKTTLLFLALVLLPFTRVAAQTPVTGYPILDNSNIATVERYLARSVVMGKLTAEGMPAPYTWNGIPVKTVPVPSWVTQTTSTSTDAGTYCYLPNQTYSLLECEGYCNYPYCPDSYRADINLLQTLDAAFIMSATGIWDGLNQFQLGSTYLAASKRTVDDINTAYDVAQKRRPIIQASIYGENVDTSVNSVDIPASVIDEFNSIMTDSDKTYYYYYDTSVGGWVPKTWLKFSFNRLSFDHHFGNFVSPDITTAEGCMWMYYQAMCYIDAGYTSLHLGQPKFWARLYTPVTGVPSSSIVFLFDRMKLVVDKMRAHAKKRSEDLHVPNVLLVMAEPYSYRDSNGVTIQVKLAIPALSNQNTDRLIFDFNIAAMRPRQVGSASSTNGVPDYTNGVAEPRSNITNCPSQYTPFDISDFNAMSIPCLQSTANRTATIDPCHGANFLPDGGGVSPLGQVFKIHTPYSVYFDHGESVTSSSSLGSSDPAENGTWGYDDSAWFSFLDDDCQAAWLTFQFSKVRSFTNSVGFLQAPGRLVAGDGVKPYRLSDHLPVQEAIRKAWEPTTPNITVTSSPCGVESSTTCRLVNHEPIPKYYAVWTLTVTNPDPTSIYTWHIQRPDKTWEPYEYGAQRVFYPTMSGQYTVGLRQDNMGLPASSFGARSYNVDASRLVSIETCCSSNKASQSEPVAANLTLLSAKQQQMLSNGGGKHTIKNLSHAHIYPVPTDGTLNVSVTTLTQDEVVISVTNVLGQSVGVEPVYGIPSAGMYNCPIDVASLPTGMYIVSIRQGNELKTLKFIK